MTFYTDMGKIATGLLTEFKQGLIELVKVTPGVGSNINPGAGTEAAPVALNGVARGVKSSFVASGQAVAGDLTVTYDVTGPIPAMTDYVKIDGKRFKIVRIIPKPAAGDVAAWMLIVRAGP